MDPRLYRSVPWQVPVPVRPSRFVPLTPSLGEFNVEVDLGRIRAFDTPSPPIPDDDLLFADLQTNPDFHAARRLGTGRGGCFRGKYIKGVGRTSLAGNWNDGRDRVHCTGHLATSGALRELVVSAYFRAKGRAHLLNGSVGLLVGAMADAIGDPTRRGCPASEEVLPCDRGTQAISVKESAFARWSNIAWLVNHIDLYRSAADLRQFFFLFVSYADPSASVTLADITPSRVVRSFVTAVERAILNFREFWRLGVFWSSPYNNLTMDGRFHDLDTVLFVGAPFLGILPKEKTGSVTVPEHAPAQIFGLEVLAYVHHVRIFYRFLVARLGSLPAMEFPFSAAEREFLRETLRAFDEQVPPDHVLLSTERLGELVSSWMREDAGLAGTDLERVETLVRVACRSRLDKLDGGEPVTMALRQLPLRCARKSTITAHAPPHAFACCEVPPAALEEAQFVNDVLSRLDAVTDRDELLRSATEAVSDITRYCAHPT